MISSVIKKDSPLFYVCIGLLAAALLTLFYGVYKTQNQTSEKEYAIKFDSLEVQEIIKGELRPAVKLSSMLAPKITVINFWASWCKICQAEVPIINSLDSWIKEHNLADSISIIGVAVQDDRLNARSSPKSKTATFKLAFDHTKAVEELFEIDFLPKTIVIKGRIEDSYWINGPLNDRSIGKIKELVKNRRGKND